MQIYNRFRVIRTVYRVCHKIRMHINEFADVKNEKMLFERFLYNFLPIERGSLKRVYLLAPFAVLSDFKEGTKVTRLRLNKCK